MAPDATMPVDLHERRERRRLATATRQAVMHATPAEYVEIQKLIDATNLGMVPVSEARSTIAALRRVQQEREGWPPKPEEDHDPDVCDLMVCAEPACIARNADIPPRGEGSASPFRKAA